MLGAALGLVSEDASDDAAPAPKEDPGSAPNGIQLAG
jgi:hypothetical protein